MLISSNSDASFSASRRNSVETFLCVAPKKNGTRVLLVDYENVSKVDLGAIPTGVRASALQARRPALHRASRGQPSQGADALRSVRVPRGG
jgi:hypothetical protein